MESNGFTMPRDDEAGRRESLLAMMRDKDDDRCAELFYTCESLMTHDELFTQWRMHHVLMVERQIGAKTGTGGSTGARYLRSTIDKRFYPELWDLRSYL
jgi:tryptophan 2,3-dioxygenase